MARCCVSLSTLAGNASACDLFNTPQQRHGATRGQDGSCLERFFRLLFLSLWRFLLRRRPGALDASLLSESLPSSCALAAAINDEEDACRLAAFDSPLCRHILPIWRRHA